MKLNICSFGSCKLDDEMDAYIISRDTEDHIAWLLQHGAHEKALAAVEAGQGRSELLDEVICYQFSHFPHLIIEKIRMCATFLCLIVAISFLNTL